MEYEMSNSEIRVSIRVKPLFELFIFFKIDITIFMPVLLRDMVLRRIKIPKKVCKIKIKYIGVIKVFFESLVFCLFFLF